MKKSVSQVSVSANSLNGKLKQSQYLLKIDI